MYELEDIFAYGSTAAAYLSISACFIVAYAIAVWQMLRQPERPALHWKYGRAA